MKSAAFSDQLKSTLFVGYSIIYITSLYGVVIVPEYRKASPLGKLFIRIVLHPILSGVHGFIFKIPIRKFGMQYFNFLSYFFRHSSKLLFCSCHSDVLHLLDHSHRGELSRHWATCHHTTQAKGKKVEVVFFFDLELDV